VFFSVLIHETDLFGRGHGDLRSPSSPDWSPPSL
jgi:hypothetical protein